MPFSSPIIFSRYAIAIYLLFLLMIIAIDELRFYFSIFAYCHFRCIAIFIFFNIRFYFFTDFSFFFSVDDISILPLSPLISPLADIAYDYFAMLIPFSRYHLRFRLHCLHFSLFSDAAMLRSAQRYAL